MKSQNQESIEKLTNGELEKVLNLILDNEVKQDNLKAITRVFESYWYTPVSKVDIDELDGKLHFINFLTEEIQKVRSEGGNGEEINSGGKLFDVVKSFIEKLSKQKGKERAFETCRKIRDLVSNSLSEDERKALTVIVSYLEAKKVK